MSAPMSVRTSLSPPNREIPEAALPPSRYLCFGRFQVDLKREELFRDGSRLRVPSKVFQVLIALLEKPGEVVRREELRERLWPQGTFVNFDANVNTTVNKLRLLLGGLTDEPGYIETIPRQGYCFTAAVERRSELARAVAPTGEAPAAADEARTDKTQATALRELLHARLAKVWANRWAAAVLLCGVLIGVGMVLIVHRLS